MNNSKSFWTIIIGLFVLGMGWYFLSEDGAETNRQSSSIYTDSIAAPERPTFTAQQDTVEEDTAQKQTVSSPPGEDLAPGTALIKAVVISADLNSRSGQGLTVKAEEVLGYGSSTSPIANQQALTVRVDRFLKNHPDRKDLLREGTTVVIVISSEQGMSLGDSSNKKRWSLVDVKSQ